MHILLVTTSFPRPNDWSRAAFNLQLCLALTAEHTVSVISPLPWRERLRAPRGERWPEWSAQLNIQYPTFYYPPGMCRWSYAPLMRLAARTAARNVAKSVRPDVVLGYWSFPDGAVASHIAREYGVPHVQMVGGSDVLLPRSGSREARRIASVLTAADHVITVGRHIRERVLALGVSPARVSIVPRGVDTRVFSPGSKTQARRRLGIPGEGVVLLWAGRLHAVKGLDVLLHASRLLMDSGVSHRLYVVGDGPLRATVRDTSDRLGVDAEIVAAVSQIDLADYYRAADLTVLSSHSEGIPNVLRESIACGTPFVATRVGGISEIARDGVDELVTAGDAAALARGIDRALGRRPEIVKASSISWSDSARLLLQALQHSDGEVRCA